MVREMEGCGEKEREGGKGGRRKEVKGMGRETRDKGMVRIEGVGEVKLGVRIMGRG